MAEDLNIKIGADVANAERAVENFVRKTESRPARVSVEAVPSGTQSPGQYGPAYGPISQRAVGPTGGWARPVSQQQQSQQQAAQSSPAAAPPTPTPRERDGPDFLRPGRLGQLASTGYLLHSVGMLADAVVTNARENRLAIADRGGEDSLRRYKADIATADSVRSIPILGNIVDAGVEFALGWREQAQGTVEAAERQNRESDRKSKLGQVRKGVQDYFRNVEGRSYATLGTGEAERATRAAEVSRDEALIDAREKFQEGMRATPGQKERNQLEGKYNDLTAGIEAAFQRTTQRIKLASEVSLRSVTEDSPVEALRAAGHYRAADRLAMSLATDREADAEEDPTRRLAIRRRGNVRSVTAEAENERNDSLVRDLADLNRQAAVLRRSGGVEGEQSANQAARRRQALGPLGALNPNAGAINRSLDEQDATELVELRRDRAFHTRGLLAERDVSGMVANRQPFGAQAEAMFRRGTMEADREGITSATNAMLRRQSTKNELLAFRNDLMLNGRGEEAAAGTFGPGGVAYGGNGKPDDSGAAVEAIERMIKKLDQLITTQNRAAGRLDEMVGDDGT